MSGLDPSNVFKYHAPTVEQVSRYATIRQKAKELADYAQANTPVSREQSVGLTNLQQAVMWFNAAIAINEAEAPSSK